MHFLKLLVGMLGATSSVFLLASCASIFKPPAPLPPSVTLSSPVDAQRISMSGEQDSFMLFQWQPHATYPIEREPLPEGWFERDPILRKLPKATDVSSRIKVYRISYRLCLFESSRCDRNGIGNKIWYGPVIDPTREIAITLPYAAWQGKTFHWAVEACTTFIDTALAKARAFSGPFCEWSPTYSMSWLLPPPIGLHTSQNPRYSSWHLELNWTELTAGVFTYEICIAQTHSELQNHCKGFSQSSSPSFEDTESDSPYRRFGEPPSGTGSKGSAAVWKVAACAGPELDVADEEKCTYSEPQNFIWPE